MLDQLKRYLLPVTPTIIPQWNQHINELRIRREEIKRRYLNNYGGDSRALRMLKHLAGSIDLDYLNNQKNDFEAYVNYFSVFGNVADYIFNPTKFGKAYRKMFYHKTIFSTTEFLIPVNDVDHIKYLPLGESWDTWKHLKPITLWYHDSHEHTLDLLKNQVHFKFDQPNYSLTFIDSTMLAMMWWKYSNTHIPEEEQTLHNFLHKYVFSKLFEDLEDIWLLNRIKNIVDSCEEDDGTTKSDTNLYGYAGGRQKEANNRLKLKIIDIKNGNLRPNNLLSSELLLSGSILNKINYAFEHLDTEHLKQYDYTRILRDLPYLELILKLHEYRPDSSYYLNLTQELRIYLKRYLSSKPWSSVADSYVRTILEDKINELYDRVKK